MLKNLLQGTATEDHQMAVQEGQLSREHSLKSKPPSPHPSPVTACGSAATFEGAFVKGVDSISWMANHSAKLLSCRSDGPHCWTFFSTAAYGKRNYENTPTATTEKVETRMVKDVEAAFCLPKGSLQKPVYTQVQLWKDLTFMDITLGAPLPTNAPSIPRIFDPRGSAGMCGNWLLGSSLGSAALSHVMALADHEVVEFAVGLRNEFQPLEGHDIGQFPGLVFAVNDPLFGQLVDHWLERGLRQRCEGVIGALEVDLVNSLHFPYSLPSYISVDGMRLFAADSFLLAQCCNLDRSSQVQYYVTDSKSQTHLNFEVQPHKEDKNI
ncbi:hypothetical protein KPL71_024223 [Citrus sinensis]|uniref:Uncharacterized protein n=1 Tax=Citrus sinensis TaxID=2711 RepID=A0ACB8IS23_CITSI|nr:hypothetical protein KPL71_024223 [Citrus sinensis]